MKNTPTSIDCDCTVAVGKRGLWVLAEGLGTDCDCTVAAGKSYPALGRDPRCGAPSLRMRGGFGA